MEVHIPAQAGAEPVDEGDCAGRATVGMGQRQSERAHMGWMPDTGLICSLMCFSAVSGRSDLTASGGVEQGANALAGRCWCYHPFAASCLEQGPRCPHLMLTF